MVHCVYLGVSGYDFKKIFYYFRSFLTLTNRVEHDEMTRMSTGSSLFAKEPIYTPTKQSNTQHLVEYKKQLLQEENKKSRYVMHQSMHSYVCGINLRSESSLVLSDLLFM